MGSEFRSMLRLAIVLVACTLLAARPTWSAYGPPRSETISVTEVIDHADSLPVEYGASLFFQAVELRPQIFLRKRQIGRYTDLFQKSSRAVFRTRIFYGGSNPLSLTAQEQNELEAGEYDELSIKSKLIQLLSLLAPVDSFRLLGQLAPAPREVPCEQVSVPNDDAYYDAVLALDSILNLQSKWSRNDLLDTATSAITSPSMLEGWLHSIPKWQFNREQWETVAHRTAERMSALHPTDREMTALERSGRLSQQVSFLEAKLKANGVDTTEILNAYRGFLVLGLSGQACSDITIERAAVRDQFTKLIASGQPSGDVRRIELKEITGVAGPPAVEDIIPFDKRLRPAMQHLFNLSDANRVRKYRDHTLEELQPDEGEVETILSLSREDYNNDKSCQVCRFDARQTVLFTLISTVPPGPGLRDVIKEEVAFVESNPVEEVSPPTWFALFQQLLNTSRTADASAQGAIEKAERTGSSLVFTPSVEAATIRSVLNSSSDPIIRTFMEAEKVLKPPYKSALQGAQ